MGISLGVASEIEDGDILAAAKALMNDAARRREMRIAGLARLNGSGAALIAADLAAALKEEKRPVRIAR
jgi:hypothetical protein